MMRGKAVIVADIGGLSEVVGDAGLKFPPGDPRALAIRIRQIIDDSALTSALGSVARSRALQLFTSENMIRNHFSKYEEIKRR
jgi:glycosyltransferase involved in cell wall biosynthesis